jgi:ABC-2 type transport system ATP-binding protein
MGQRLGVATALLGDPQTLLLDEPVNGLDPEGIQWIRNLLRGLAAEGRTVFVSSHLMSEIAVTADHLIVIGKGRLIADSSTAAFIEQSSEGSVLVRSPDARALAPLLERQGATVSTNADVLTARHLPAPRIGELAAQQGFVLHELTPQRASLEEAFMELTRDSVEYRAPAPAEPAP